MQLITNLLPDGIPCDTKRHFDNGQPSGIVIHWTGPYPGQTPSQVRQWWIDSKGEASAHFIIKDSTVLQCWETDKVAWHCGCPAGNNSTLGIEIIPEDKEGKFSALSIKTLKQLLDTLPKLPLTRHYDWSGKDCPKYYVDSHHWNELLHSIQSV